MKKIIYSLVIMIAAGSLFTSCVENTEPQGIKDIRQAKADYIESLAKLNAANEALVAAEAAYKNAETAVKNAEVAVVEAQAAKAQAEAAQEQAKVEIIKAQAEAAKIANEKAVAELNHQLALDSLALVEKLIEMAQSEQINALFIEAQKAELAKQLAMDSARIMQMFLEIAEQQEVYAYNAELRKADLEEYKARVEKNIKGYEADIARYEADIRDAQDRIAKAEAQAQKDALDLEKELVQKKAALLAAQHALEQQEAAYLAFLAEVELRSYQLSPAEKSAVKEYKDAYTAVIAAKQKVRKVEELIFEENAEIEDEDAEILDALKSKVIFDSTAVEFYKEQIAEVEARLASLPDSGKTAEEVKALQAEYKEKLAKLEYEQANVDKEYNTYLKTQLGEPVTGFATELSEWVVKNAALPAPFDMHFKAELPDNGAVSALFAESVKDLPGVETGNGYIVANFKTSNDAFDGVEAIDSIIDAISRKYIIDKVGNASYDTVGLAAAVKAEQEKYDAIADTLTDGLGKYKPFVDAQDSVKKAVEDTTKAFAEYRKAYSADTATWNAYRKSAGDAKVAEDTLGEYMRGKWAQAKQDSTNKGREFKTAKSALKTATENKEKAENVLDSLVDLSENLDSWRIEAEEALEIANAKVNAANNRSNIARNKLNDARWTAGEKEREYNNAYLYNIPEGANVDSLRTEAEKAKAAFESAKKDTAVANQAVRDAEKVRDKAWEKCNELWAINPGELDGKIAAAKADTANCNKAFVGADTTFANAKAALAKAVEAYNKAANDTLELTNAFKAAVKDSTDALNIWHEKDSLYFVAVADTAAAVDSLGRAVTEIYPAAKAKFYAIYGKFWGVEPQYDAETDFLKDSIEIAPKEFADIFKKSAEGDTAKFNDIVKFSYSNVPYYKDGKFVDNYYGDKCSLISNKEIEIIKDQLKAHNVTDFEATLLCQLFAKQQYSEKVFAAVGTIDNEKALKALAKIKEDLADAFVAAGQKQEEASKPFFEFVQNLVGEEFLNSVFARVDKAIAKYAEFIDEKVNPSTMDIIAKAVAQGKTTSKQVFTYWFEYELCNKAGSTYRNVYAGLQIADAFAKEEFRQLISDVIANVIKEANLDGDVELVSAETPLETALHTVALNKKAGSEDLLSEAIKLFAPNLAAYLVHAFDGKVAELQKKWFAEWSEKRDEYNKATAEIAAKEENILNLCEVLKAYVDDEAISALITKENLSEGYIGWMKVQLDIFEYALAEAKAALDAFVAGPDIYEQHIIEHLADVLAKAENDLSVAEKRLEVATAAYNKVLESHSIAE